MEEDGKELFTDKIEKEFGDIIANIPGSSDHNQETDAGKKFSEYWQPRISQIIERYLGKGKKIKDATRDQVEAIDLILTDLKDLIKG